MCHNLPQFLLNTDESRLSFTISIMCFDPDPLSRYAIPVFPLEVPSATESSAIHSHLKYATTELHKLDIMLAIILASRERVISRIQRCHYALAPYRRLPTELIREIIQLCVPQRSSFPLEAGKNDPHLQITQVCSSWRHIAFSTPTIWEMTFDKDYLLKSSVELAKSWLGQSSMSGFSLGIFRNSRITPAGFLIRSDRIAQPELLLLKELVVSNSQQLRSLELGPDKPQWDLIHYLPFDNLTTLIIEPHFQMNDQLGDLLSAPVLRSVRILVNPPIPRPTKIPTLPWGQLTHLSIFGMFQMSGILPLLASCTSIEVCRLHTIMAAFPHLPVVLLPHLESLLLTLDSNIPTMFDFLGFLKLPSLSSLMIPSLTPFGQDTAPALINFVRTVATTLRQFEVRLPTTDLLIDETFITVLSPVTHLIFQRGYRLSPSIVSNIVSGVMLPNLEHFEFGLSEKDNAQSIVEMLSARSPSTSHPISIIKKVVIYCYNLCWEDPIQPQLQDLRSQGMEIISREPPAIPTHGG